MGLLVPRAEDGRGNWERLRKGKCLDTRNGGDSSDEKEAWVLEAALACWMGMVGFSLLLRLQLHPPGTVKGLPAGCGSAVGG